MALNWLTLHHIRLEAAGRWDKSRTGCLPATRAVHCDCNLNGERRRSIPRRNYPRPSSERKHTCKKCNKAHNAAHITPLIHSETENSAKCSSTWKMWKSRADFVFLFLWDLLWISVWSIFMNCRVLSIQNITAMDLSEGKEEELSLSDESDQEDNIPLEESDRMPSSSPTHSSESGFNSLECTGGDKLVSGTGQSETHSNAAGTSKMSRSRKRKRSSTTSGSGTPAVKRVDTNSRERWRQQHVNAAFVSLIKSMHLPKKKEFCVWS